MIKIAIMILMTSLLVACSDYDSRVAERNISVDSDNFKIMRRVVFYNGITDAYILEITGLCSVDPPSSRDSTIRVICKTGPGQYKKHMLGASDNVTYFVEQLNSAAVDTYHYKVIFKPSVIIPSVKVSL